LLQVDVDGTSIYSPVRAVALASSVAGLALFPNPTTHLTTLTGTTAHAPVQVLDVLGRTVLTATADADGAAALALPAGLAPGVYVVRTGTQAVLTSSQLLSRLKVEVVRGGQGGGQDNAVLLFSRLIQ
jgi:hypothetical protein